MRFIEIMILSVLLTFPIGDAAGQQESQQKKQKQRRKNPAMQPVTDIEGLPRVLLIGDSISIGYTVPVREMLDGKANVHRPLTNCGPTTNGLKNIDKWLPTQEDRDYVKSCMVKVHEAGKFANWIAPPPVGVNEQPLDFEYVKIH